MASSSVTTQGEHHKLANRPALHVLLILYTAIISFRPLLSMVAPSSFSLNSDIQFSTSSRRLSVSNAIVVLVPRFRKRDNGLGVFLGALLGLGVSAASATRVDASFGIWDGVLGRPSCSTLGEGRQSSSVSAMGAGRAQEATGEGERSPPAIAVVVGCKER